MPAIKAVTVFGGAASGSDPVFRETATALGRGLGGGRNHRDFRRRQHRHDGGGGRWRARRRRAGDRHHSGFPRPPRGRPYQVSEMIVTDSMHSRKRRMFEMSDAFVTLPGGLGTLDETFEMITWRQLDLHAKPVLICDVGGWGSAFQTHGRQLYRHGLRAPARLMSSSRCCNSVEAIVDRLTELPAIETATATCRASEPFRVGELPPRLSCRQFRRLHEACPFCSGCCGRWGGRRRGSWCSIPMPGSAATTSAERRPTARANGEAASAG